MNFTDRTDLPEGVLKAIEDYESIKDDPNLQMEAVSKQIAIMDYFQVIEDAENRGKAKAYAKNFERGRAEAQKQVATNMKALGFNPDIIAQATGLDLETIENL